MNLDSNFGTVDFGTILTRVTYLIYVCQLTNVWLLLSNISIDEERKSVPQLKSRFYPRPTIDIPQDATYKVPNSWVKIYY